MTIQTYTIDSVRYWVSCQHTAWTPCTDAARDGEPQGWMSDSDGRAGGDFFTDAPWTEVAPDDCPHAKKPPPPATAKGALS
ncbi:hypothetical protein ACH4FX_12560 [Streptomyces sp. NPDC018019]|uniref:hypothetical protein n=1 Tax=Streptomyces sp. NPDC018019 TaxID=3365030 RepID=UPI0037B8B5B9